MGAHGLGRTVTTALVTVALLGGCTSEGRDNAPEADGKLDVVASFYPLFEVATRVGGDRANVTNLVTGGAEPHDLELGPQQVERLEDADVAVLLGAGFQPAAEKAAKNRASGTVIVLDNGRDGDDPHVWLDPRRMKAIASDLARAFGEQDKTRAAVYEENAASYIAELDDLDGRMRAGLTGCARTVIVTSHDAFGHLAAAYGLQQEPVAGLAPEAEPDPKRLDELTRRIKDTGTTTVFTETLASPKVAETLAREAGVDTAVLNPIEGLTADDAKAGKTYLTLMDENLEALRTALGCP